MSFHRLCFYFALLNLLGWSSFSHALLIAQHLTDTQSVNLLDYENSYQDGFGHSAEDHFQELQQGKHPLGKGLLDESLEQSDNLGLIIKAQDNSPFFAAQDVENSANPDGRATARWRFDIANYSALRFSLDLAAMGDFERSDWFRWEYSIDDHMRQSLFDIQAEEQTLQSYQLASGSLITLDDPLLLTTAKLSTPPINELLSNQFQTFTAELLGTGSRLDLFFTAQQNGGNEVLAFRNLVIDGSDDVRGVSLPSSFSLMLLGIVLSGISQRKVTAEN